MTSLGDKAAAAAKSSPEGRQAWETRRQRQPRAAAAAGRQEQPLGDKAAAAAKSSPEGTS